MYNAFNAGHIIMYNILLCIVVKCVRRRTSRAQPLHPARVNAITFTIRGSRRRRRRVHTAIIATTIILAVYK